VFSAATNKYLQQKGSVDSESPLNCCQFLLIDACFGFWKSQREVIKIMGREN
jgi:hypothetical protein